MTVWYFVSYDRYDILQVMTVMIICQLWQYDILPVMTVWYFASYDRYDILPVMTVWYFVSYDVLPGTSPEAVLLSASLHREYASSHLPSDWSC